MKVCTKCKKEKLPSEFFSRTTKEKKDGMRSHCKSCCKEKTSDYYGKNKEKYKEINRKWYLKNRERFIEYNRLHPEETREYNLRKKFGMGIEDYKKLLIKQKYSCLICGISESKGSRWGVLVVDHCHQTGKIRGLLCSHCNTGLGSFRDNPKFLDQAIKYLNQNHQTLS